MISAIEALERLRQGNQRYASDLRSLDALVSHTRRAELVGGQTPFAIVLGCSDSRVPAELVFDSGLGDLFVIRVAGNVVAPSQVGSVEFAAQRFGVRLVVVLGHTNCGAICATLEQLRQRAVTSRLDFNPSLRGCARPSSLYSTPSLASDEEQALMRQAVRANVRASVDHRRHGSEIIERLVCEEGLLGGGGRIRT